MRSVIPPACLHRDAGTTDIFSMNPKEAASHLNDHFRWYPSHESHCNFMSWTSSLLFAIQYGLYRHRGARVHVPLSDIRLLVIDTSCFPKGTFIKDLEIMRYFAEYSDPQTSRNLAAFTELRLGKKGYYFGEYLTQGELDISGACAEATMQNIMDHGLLELLEELGDRLKWKKWAQIVVDLRETFGLRFETTDRADVRRAITIASGCFGDRFAIPIAAMLLALKNPRPDDQVILRAFSALFTCEERIPPLGLVIVLTSVSRGDQGSETKRAED